MQGLRRNGRPCWVSRILILNMKKVLDLYCGEGGCSMGYYQAGFDVTGVDKYPMPNYPFKFIQADALEILDDIDFCRSFDLIHASPVCKRYSMITKTAGTQNNHNDDIQAVRQRLRIVGKPYIIENVPGAPLKDYIMLCGTMFGLGVVRHRLFECNPGIHFPPALCNHHKKVVKHGRPPDRKRNFAAVTGHFSDVAFARESMGITWMGQSGLSQAIPPAYTEWLGRQMLSNCG